MIEPPPQKVIFVCGEQQIIYDEIAEILENKSIEVEFAEGMPNLNELDKETPKLLIYDDVAGTAADEQIAKVFAVKSHHRNASAIYITQNLFQGKTANRTINKNACYLILTKNVRDSSFVSYIGRQMFPQGQGKFLIEVYKDSTKRPYSYLFLDFRQDTEDDKRVLTGIFPDEETVVYLPKI